MWLVWIVGGLAGIVGTGYLFDKKIGKPLNDKLKAATGGADPKKPGKKPEPPPTNWTWLWVSLGLLVAGGLTWWFLRKPAPKGEGDTDFYAGALGIPIDEARKMTKAYLAGQWAAKKRNEGLTKPGDVLGLKPTSVTATFGKKNFDFGGSYGTH